MQVVTLPNLTRIVDVVNFAYRLEARVKILGSKAAIYIKFPMQKIFFPPFAQIYLGLTIRRLTKQYRCLITYMNTDVDWLWFPKSNGFFTLTRPKFSEGDFNQNNGDDFIPIRYLNVPDVSIDDAHVHESEVKRMQSIGDDLAERLIRDSGTDTKETLSYLCREILRNIVEHSFSESMYYSAQFNQNTRKVEVVIADEGEGLKEGLSMNPHLNIKDDKEAIKLAILPGVSGRAHKYTNRGRYDNYKNSGYGLYMAEKICAEAGNFLIISGKSARNVKGKNARYLQNVNFEGTILRLIIDADNVHGIEDRLQKYRDDAQKIIKRVKSVTTVTPSAASLMLRL